MCLFSIICQFGLHASEANIHCQHLYTHIYVLDCVCFVFYANIDHAISF